MLPSSAWGALNLLIAASSSGSISTAERLRLDDRRVTSLVPFAFGVGMVAGGGWPVAGGWWPVAGADRSSSAVCILVQHALVLVYPYTFVREGASTRGIASTVTATALGEGSRFFFRVEKFEHACEVPRRRNLVAS